MHFLTPVLAEELPPAARHSMSVTFEVRSDAGIIARCASHQFVQKVRWRGGLGRPAGEFHLLAEHRPAMWWDNQLWMDWYVPIFEKSLHSVTQFSPQDVQFLHACLLAGGGQFEFSSNLLFKISQIIVYYLATCYDISDFDLICNRKKQWGSKYKKKKGSQWNMGCVLPC